MALERYRGKRDFDRTPEPAGWASPAGSGYRFVVQMHQARHLHYDFRLELDGVLKSWAVPKGPCLDPSQKRLAVHVEDHPIEYGDFEGVIPPGQYGSGAVIVWDRGTWHALDDPAQAYASGRLKFRLEGVKLKGAWMLVRLRARAGEKDNNWLLMKERDSEARALAHEDILVRSPESVLSGRTVRQVAADPSRQWQAGTRERFQASDDQGSAPELARAARRLQGARKTEPPLVIEPQLARLTKRPPAGGEWIHEIKFDGYRLLARIAGGQVGLFTRNQHDWTERFPEVAQALSLLPVQSAWLDGELVALDARGVSRFQDLQNAFRNHASSRLVLQVFDLLYLDGVDLRGAPLLERKQLLRRLLAGAVSPRLRYTDHMVGQGPEFQRQCCAMGLEGVISKRGDGAYRPGRGPGWLKAKCIRRDEFVIGGYTLPEGGRLGLGALLLGYHGAGQSLEYAGRVGTGFTDASLADLRERLGLLEQRACPFDGLAAADRRKTRWVQPVLVAQVEYAGWTDDGRLRHPSFQGLREDRPARSVVHPSAGPKADEPGPTASRPAATAARGEPSVTIDRGALMTEAKLRELAHIHLTHPGKILYPDVGLTKLDLAAYYVAVSDWILPHLAGRPVTLVRCPDGATAECFYQKHAAAGTPVEVERVTIREKEAKGEYLVVNHLAALASLVQIGVLEIHPWPARVDRIDRPDRIIFDLDPDPELPWKHVVAAAVRMRQELEDLGLLSFVKTTGGKGLHVVVPIVRRHGWREVKQFAEAVARRLVADQPQRFTATMSKAARTGKIYIDYQRNNRGSTAIAPYATRARPGATVATPLRWDELTENLRPHQFHVGTLPARIAALGSDPWLAMSQVRQSLTRRALAALKR